MNRKLLLSSIVFMLFVTLFLPDSTFAKTTVYKTGYAKFDTYFQTGSFYLPKGTIYYDDRIKKCKKREQYRVEYWKTSGSKIATLNLTCEPNIIGHVQYWAKINKAGNYYLKFVNVTGGTKDVTSYKVYKK